MRNVHHSSSSRKAALLVMSTLLAMSGCSQGTRLLSTDGGFLSSLNVDALPPAAAPSSIYTADLTTASTVKAQTIVLPLRPRIEPAADIRTVPSSSDENGNLWCRHFKEDAAAQSVILRSPTLAGSIDEQGKSELNLTLSASSFVKAKIGEELALANCRKFLAESSLQTIVFVSPQNLTAAGFKARSDSIFNQRQDIAKLHKMIEAAMNKGSIDREKASAMIILTERLLAEGDLAKSQADRRIDEHPVITKTVETLKQELLDAETDLDALKSRTRSADNMDVSVLAGYSNPDTFNTNGLGQGGVSGKVSFSLKLGVLAPERFEHEQRSYELKQQALRSGSTGILWQVEALRHSHERSIAGLVESQKKIDKAIKEARHLLAVLDSVPQPEFEGARLNTRFEIMKLNADKAGVVGSLAEIKVSLKRLQNG
jgi:hypothetical protein